MLINPADLRHDLNRLEEIEKASLRLVVQALVDYREVAEEVFRQEVDLVADIAEDITREALDRIGTSRIEQRLFGKVDYKRARYLFHPQYAIKQALFVDSKAELTQATVTLQTSQFSMRVYQKRSGVVVQERGKLPTVLTVKNESYLTTTVFVKYNYEVIRNRNILKSITVAALPSGMLQQKYNPNADDTIWRVGRNAPTRGEEFRVRLKFSLLKAKANWRVQEIDVNLEEFTWDE